MSEPWYQAVSADQSLTQGDLIFSCPLLTWGEASGADTLSAAAHAFEGDVVVMTQACDLEQRKVSNVVLCPHDGITAYRQKWQAAMEGTGNTPSKRAWASHCKAIANGHIWYLAFLNEGDLGDGKLRAELRVVDFREVFTAPRAFLEGLLHARKQTRLRLLPPYREHLSQAFARFFMRVGLPQGIPDTAWEERP